MERVIRFDAGTLLLEGFPPEELPVGFEHDPRVGLPRGRAMAYRDVAMHLHRSGLPWSDQARGFDKLDRPHRSAHLPRDYQQAAIEAWIQRGKQGVVVLPTGAGKSLVAELAIREANRHALVVAPTINLVGQWYDRLRRAFGDPVGVLGGGAHEICDITVSTYDSAWIHVERYGARFGLIVFDEVHHLPGASYSLAAEGSIAPFRLGLSATLERPDGRHLDVERLVGPTVFERGIADLAGDFLAEYRTECISVHLDPEDREAYDAARHRFRSFIEISGVRLGGRNGWENFLRAAGRSKEGRDALLAHREARKILDCAPAKLRMLEELLREHRDGRVLIFTNDNATVYQISRLLLVPAITHQTSLKERVFLLRAFAAGTLPVLATSRVLNEGVDVPEADVAVVLSGTSTVREHVQRLGRILRQKEGKSAVLYEIVVADSTEEAASARRREHDAYRRG
jgi:superfamily II DNA or RNA helicase